ncbi:MAG: hypothetical protein KBS76_02865 [Ruminococcus sp.]|nr:hypothetical protein [Candidatus Apopatosoma intestinale]
MRQKTLTRLREMAVFAMLGTLMFLSKQLLEFLPNIHMLALFTCVYTLVYRIKALIPLYIFVFLEGVIAGFNLWWIPYLYIWTVLWGAFMLFPKTLPARRAAILCPIVCALHGMLYGTLYAPMQAVMFGYSFHTTLVWIATGLPWDAVQAAGNLVMGTLAVPLILVLERLEKKKVLI